MSWLYTKTPTGWKLPPRRHHLFTENRPLLFHKEHYSPSVCHEAEVYLQFLVSTDLPQGPTARSAHCSGGLSMFLYSPVALWAGDRPAGLVARTLATFLRPCAEGAVGILEEMPSEQGLLRCLLQGGISCKQFSGDVLVSPHHAPFKLLFPQLVLCMHRLHWAMKPVILECVKPSQALHIPAVFITLSF